MPEYLYRNVDEISCDHCRDGFSVRQGMTDPPLTICPRCGAAIQRAVVPVYGGVKRGGNLEKRAKNAGFQVLRKDDDGSYKPG